MLGRLHEGNDSCGRWPANSTTVSKGARGRTDFFPCCRERMINKSNSVSRKWDHRELIHDFAATRAHRSARPDSTGTNLDPFAHRGHLVRGESDTPTTRPGMADSRPGIWRRRQ